jgi:hypothetical protein
MIGTWTPSSGVAVQIARIAAPPMPFEPPASPLT